MYSMVLMYIYKYIDIQIYTIALIKVLCQAISWLARATVMHKYTYMYICMYEYTRVAEIREPKKVLIFFF